jgi:hypothetical protein
MVSPPFAGANVQKLASLKKNSTPFHSSISIVANITDASRCPKSPVV